MSSCDCTLTTPDPKGMYFPQTNKKVISNPMFLDGNPANNFITTVHDPA